MPSQWRVIIDEKFMIQEQPMRHRLETETGQCSEVNAIDCDVSV